MQAAIRLTTNDIGKGFEKEFAALSLMKGLQVTPALNSRYDFVINGYRTECKCLTPIQKSINRFEIKIKNSRDKLGYDIGDFDVLAVKVLANLYIVPMMQFPTSRNKKKYVTAVDTAWLFKFKDNWEAFHGAYLQQQPYLF